MVKEKLLTAIATIEELKKHNEKLEQNLSYETNKNELIVKSEIATRAKLELAIDDIQKLNNKLTRNEKDHVEIMDNLTDQINEANHKNQELYQT